MRTISWELAKTIMTYDRNFEAYPVLLISDKSIKTFVNFIKNKTFDNFKMQAYCVSVKLSYYNNYQYVVNADAAAAVVRVVLQFLLLLFILFLNYLSSSHFQSVLILLKLNWQLFNNGKFFLWLIFNFKIGRLEEKSSSGDGQTIISIKDGLRLDSDCLWNRWW